MNGKQGDTIAAAEFSRAALAIRHSLIEYGADHTVEELLTKFLDEIGILLDSPIGFYCFVQPDQQSLSFQQWSSRTPAEISRSIKKGTLCNISKAGNLKDCVQRKKAVICNPRSSPEREKRSVAGYGNAVRELVVPVIRNNMTTAVLGVQNKPVDYTKRDVEIVSYLADVTWEIVLQMRSDEALRKTTFDLHERVKELSCLYGISKLAEEDDLTVDETIQRTVDLIPPSWQYPEITCAQITLYNRTYRTKHFRNSEWSQSQEIRVNRERVGVLEIFLRESKPEKGEGPFLTEERNLLNAIAERLGNIIEHKRAAEALQKSHDELQLRVEERTKELAAQNRQLLNEIRERKKAEEELHRSSEKIKLFAYSVAHDLKNPAIATYGLARILNKKFGNKLNDDGKRICEQIKQSSEDIAALAEKINTFISAKETPLQIENISLREVFLILEEEFSSQLSIRSVQLVIPEAYPETIVADRLSILRIFRNIIDNSLKYGGEELNRIEIGYQLTDFLHIFTVTDDGQGLAENDSANIFQWFKRQKAATETQGSGIGLAIVSDFAALHGGEVWLVPARPKGVTFCFSLSRHLKPTESVLQD